MNNKIDVSIIISVQCWIVVNTSKEKGLICFLGMIILRELG